MKTRIISIAAAFCFYSCLYSNPKIIQPKILRVLPHHGRGFTQGLLILDSVIVEGTGLENQSKLNVFGKKDGTLIKTVPLEKYFGEGLALSGTHLYQLTWKAGRVLVYTVGDLRLTDSLRYAGEGWGLTRDSRYFIMSNGSDTLFFRDHQFREVRKIPVTAEGKPVYNLNELEYANGKVYSNIWYQGNVVEIDPVSGRVSRVIDCRSLFDIEKPESRDMVLNGIAYDPARKSFYLTGKLWKNIFEVSWPEP